MRCILPIRGKGSWHKGSGTSPLLMVKGSWILLSLRKNEIVRCMCRNNKNNNNNNDSFTIYRNPFYRCPFLHSLSGFAFWYITVSETYVILLRTYSWYPFFLRLSVLPFPVPSMCKTTRSNRSNVVTSITFCRELLTVMIQHLVISGVIAVCPRLDDLHVLYYSPKCGWVCFGYGIVYIFIVLAF